MKRKSTVKADFATKFRNEELERTKMNFLIGGDGNGGQGGTDDPWDPNN